LDLVCDVVLQQQKIAKATILDLKAANTIVTKAKKYAEGVGLFFPYLAPPLKGVDVCDSSHASKGSSYAQEAVLILLMSDKEMVLVKADSALYKAIANAQENMSDFCHVVASLSHKAKRISSSTSMAECLAAIIGKELGQLVCIRLTELLGHGIQVPLNSASPLTVLTKIQEVGGWVIPLDHCTDCRDLFQLVIGEKGVPQDRYQRLYILSLREDRIKGAIRHFIWIPTAAMVADALTKVMISPIMYDLLTHGYWQLKCVGLQGQKQDPLLAPALTISRDYTESDLLDPTKHK
jgi:hypothetical protein